MDEIIEFFEKLFDTSDWPPRWHCGNWTDFHGWLYIISDITIWACYFAIPLLLLLLITKRTYTPFPRVFWLFIAFILLCGLTHLIDAIIFWLPIYRISALMRFFTAIISFFTVLSLVKILPIAYSLRTSAELEKEILERKKAEQEVEQHQIIQQKTLELLKNKDDFMTIASHELKTPITSVKAALQIIEKKVSREEVNTEEIKLLLNKATNQVSRLTQIVDDLLNVSRIQTGKLELNKVEFFIIDLINECRYTFQTEDIKHQIVVEGDTNIELYADYNKIQQVLINLISNAIKYSPQAEKLIVNVNAHSNFTKITVTDFGIGIPPSAITKIFDRYYRVENSSQKFSGLGLGLFISKNIIIQHGGEMGVESEEGNGTRFWFTIPSKTL